MSREFSIGDKLVVFVDRTWIPGKIMGKKGELVKIGFSDGSIQTMNPPLSSHYYPKSKRLIGAPSTSSANEASWMNLSDARQFLTEKEGWEMKNKRWSRLNKAAPLKIEGVNKKRRKVATSPEKRNKGDVAEFGKKVKQTVIPGLTAGIQQISNENLDLIFNDYGQGCLCPPPDTRGFWNETGNNCFMDSVIIAMFSSRQSPFHRLIKNRWLDSNPNEWPVFSSPVCFNYSQYDPKLKTVFFELLKALPESKDKKNAFEYLKSILGNPENLRELLDQNMRGFPERVIIGMDRLLRVVIQALLKKEWDRIIKIKDKSACDPALRKLLGRYCRTTEQDMLEHQGTRYHAADAFYLRLMEILNENQMIMPVMHVGSKVTVRSELNECSKMDEEAVNLLDFAHWTNDWNPLKQLFAPPADVRNQSEDGIMRQFGPECHRLLRVSELTSTGKNKEDEDLYRIQIQETKTIISDDDTSMIILNRDHLNGGAGEQPANMPHKINLQGGVGRGEDRIFHLCSVVCAWDLHYTCLLNCFGKWYHYNDSSAHYYTLKDQEVDKETALKIIATHGKMFFYYPEAHNMALEIEGKMYN